MVNYSTDQFKQGAENLRLQPSERVWNRLEKRLDQDKGKIRISIIKKWTAIAASFALIITVISIYSGPKETLVDIEELNTSAQTSFARYAQAVALNNVYAKSDWRNISEGEYKRGQVVKKN